MSAQPRLKQKYIIEEYLELSKNSEERLEYFDGEVFSIASGKLSHSGIRANVIAAMRALLGNRACQIYGGDAAGKTGKALPFRMPDVSVVCGEQLTEDFRGITMLLNPVLIGEALSANTESYDRDDKFLAYQAIESFQEYLLIEQHHTSSAIIAESATNGRATMLSGWKAPSNSPRWALPFR